MKIEDLKIKILKILAENPTQEYRIEQFQVFADDYSFMNVAVAFNDLSREKRVSAKYAVMSKVNPNHRLLEIFDSQEIPDTCEDLDGSTLTIMVINLQVLWRGMNPSLLN